MYSTKLKNIPALISRIVLAVFFIPGGIYHFSKDPAIYRNQFINDMAATNYMWQFVGIMLLVASIGLFILQVQLIVIKRQHFLFHIRYQEGGELGDSIYPAYKIATNLR
jgi:hypothetical protein